MKNLIKDGTWVVDNDNNILFRGKTEKEANKFIEEYNQCEHLGEHKLGICLECGKET